MPALSLRVEWETSRTQIAAMSVRRKACCCCCRSLPCCVVSAERGIASPQGGRTRRKEGAGSEDARRCCYSIGGIRAAAENVMRDAGRSDVRPHEGRAGVVGRERAEDGREMGEVGGRGAV